ncbi:sugar ABC transporter ATPase [Microbacterium sp. GXF6406]
MSSTSDAIPDRDEDVLPQPLRDRDATTNADPSADPAQAEWERTEALDRGEDPDGATATGRDPAEIPEPDDQIPDEDLPSSTAQPETQGEDPAVAELGEGGEGDLAPEDL